MKLTTFMAVIAMLLTTKAYNQTKGYLITATLKGVPNGKEFYLVHNNDDGSPDTVARTKAHNGKIRFSGKMVSEGELYFLKMDTAYMGFPKDKISYYTILLDHSDVNMNGIFQNWPEVVDGSGLTASYKKMVGVFTLYGKEYNDNAMKASIMKDGLLVSKTVLKFQQQILDYIRENSSSFTSAYLANIQNEILGLEGLKRAISLMDVKLINSFYGKKITTLINSMELSSKIAIGKIVPEFYITTPEGSKESIISLAKKSKLTLIDFWAYWCKPCRDDIPNMKEVFQEFNRKGFNIISVSVDPKISEWKKALQEENTPWINGIQQGRPSVDIFRLRGIPGYILLNEKAEIIAMDITSPITTSFAGIVNGQQAYFNAGKNGLRGDALHKAVIKFFETIDLK